MWFFRDLSEKKPIQAPMAGGFPTLPSNGKSEKRRLRNPICPFEKMPKVKGRNEMKVFTLCQFVCWVVVLEEQPVGKCQVFGACFVSLALNDP